MATSIRVLNYHSVMLIIVVSTHISEVFLGDTRIKYCLSYLAYGCITMRWCVKYIHDPDTTLTFDLKVKFVRFMTWLCVQASAFLSFNIVILCLGCECITMVRYVMYFHELCMTLTFASKSKFYILSMDLSLARCLCSLT